jgi:hypothetical protein
MATIRVGTKHIGRGTGYEADVGAEGVEVFQMWVELNGARLDIGNDLLGVDYVFDNDKSSGYAVIRLQLSTGGFSTVDHREESPALGSAVGEAFVRAASGDVAAAS